MTEQQLSDLYTNYYPRSTFDVERWAPPIDRSRLHSWWRGLKSSAYRWVPRNVRVLDIGCGFGESLGYHRSRGCDAHGVEADRNIVRVAERHELNVSVGLFNPSNYDRSSFDVVTMDQVLEHLSDPLAVLRGINSILKPGGFLIISTPNVSGWGAYVFGRRWVHWHAPYHQQFFTSRSMSQAAKAAGFVLISRTTVTSSSWINYQWQHLVGFPAPGNRSAVWSPKQRPTLKQRICLRVLLWIDRLGINALLTRVFDWLALGDNTIFVLHKPE